jgi:hypothetical protein
MAAAEDGFSGVLDHAREHGIPPNKRPRTADLMDLPLFSTEEVPHGDPRPGLNREHFPDGEPRLLLRREPVARRGRQMPAPLRQVPGDNRAPLHVETIDRPGTEKLQRGLGVVEIPGRTRDHVAEAATRVVHHVEDEPFINGMDGRWVGCGRPLVAGAEAALLVLLPATTWARGVARNLWRSPAAQLERRLIECERTVRLVRDRHPDGQVGLVGVRLADGLSGLVREDPRMPHAECAERLGVTSWTP